MYKETVNLLGHKAKDKVTGFSGVITTVCFDLYGCVQAALTPASVDNKAPESSNWYDVNRLIISDERVMPVPSFAATIATFEKGPAEKQCPR